MAEKNTGEDYHSQEGAKTPRLTYSTAKVLLSKSPLHAWYQHPLLGGHHRQPTKAMDTGSILHDLFLGGGNELAVLPYDSYRKKEAQEARDNAYAEDKIPVLDKDMAECRIIHAAVDKQLKQLLPEFYTPHLTEHPVIWTADNGVICQSKYDWISPTTGLMIDLKFTTDASPEKCIRKIIDMSYDLQEAFYTEAFNKTFPDMAGRTKWLFIFAEITEPYAVSIIETSAEFKELGQMKMNKALATWKECLDSDAWPSYGYNRVEAPGWAVYKMMGEE